MSMMRRMRSEEDVSALRQALATTPLLAVYGTLRRGLWNSPIFGSAARIAARDTVAGYRMRQTAPGPQGGIPAVFGSGPDSLVTVEVFDFSTIEDEDDRLARFYRIEAMELGCGYERRLITTLGGHRAWMYAMPPERGTYFAFDVPSGDWLNYTGVQ